MKKRFTKEKFSVFQKLFPSESNRFIHFFGRNGFHWRFFIMWNLFCKNRLYFEANFTAVSTTFVSEIFCNLTPLKIYLRKWKPEIWPLMRFHMTKIVLPNIFSWKTTKVGIIWSPQVFWLKIWTKLSGCYSKNPMYEIKASKKDTIQSNNILRWLDSPS